MAWPEAIVCKKSPWWATGIALLLMLAAGFTGCASQAAGSLPTEAENGEEAALHITVGGEVLTATLADNSSAEALRALLEEGPVSLDMRDYAGMEKVADLGVALPTNDAQLTTAAGDLILYQGSAFVIYYAPNSWSLTRLGSIDGISPEALREMLGTGDVTVTLSLAE